MAKKVVIDSGHGGVDGGSSGNGILEKEYTLKISNYIKKRLDELGIENAMTRTSDELLDQSTRPKKAQSFFGKGNDVIVLSNHLNAGGANGKNVVKVSSVLFALKQKNFGSMLKFFFCISLKSLFRS